MIYRPLLKSFSKPDTLGIHRFHPSVLFWLICREGNQIQFGLWWTSVAAHLRWQYRHTCARGRTLAANVEEGYERKTKTHFYHYVNENIRTFILSGDWVPGVFDSLIAIGSHHIGITGNIATCFWHAQLPSIRHHVVLRKAGAPVSWRRRWRLLDRGSISASGAMSLASLAWANVCKEK